MQIKDKFSKFIDFCKQIPGDPDYIARGMGIGIFVCATPTFPFQTFLAIALSFIVRGSKSAAIVGSWIGLPVVPFFYIGAFKIGMLLTGNGLSADAQKLSFSEILHVGLDLAGAMMAGGVLIGAPAGIAAYLITRKIYFKLKC